MYWDAPFPISSALPPAPSHANPKPLSPDQGSHMSLQGCSWLPRCENRQSRISLYRSLSQRAQTVPPRTLFHRQPRRMPTVRTFLQFPLCAFQKDSVAVHRLVSDIFDISAFRLRRSEETPIKTVK